MNSEEITGRARSHIVELEQPRCALHYAAAASFLAMHDAAKTQGLDLQCRSSFRDFDAQLRIWNRKWRGELPLYSHTGVLLDHASLNADALLDAILTWSALPGGSRHHWGTDVDLIDAAAIPADYSVKLVPEEYADGGPFARLSHWLDQHAHAFGFYRPYRTDRGGVSPEPWHFSYAPVSGPALESLSLSVLRETLATSEMDGKPQVLARLPEIYTRYLLAVDAPQKSDRYA